MRTAPDGWFTLEPAEGAYAKIPAWWSREQWLTTLTSVLTSPEGDQVRRTLGPALATVLRVAAADAAAADGDTGRGVQTSHLQVARELGVSEDTVRLSRRVISRVGFSTTPEGAVGRQLGEEERAAIFAKTGRHVWRVASTRALTVPREYVSSPPPRRSLVASEALAQSTHQARKQRARRDATTTRPAQKHRPSLRTQKVAARLARRLGYLDQPGRHIGQLCTVLDRSFAPYGGLDALPHCPDRPADPDNPSDHGFRPDAWITSVLVNAIDHQHATENRTTLAHQADNAIGWLAWCLDAAVSADVVTQLRQDLEHAARRARSSTTDERNTTMTSTDTLAPNPPAVLTVYSKPSCVMCTATYRSLDKLGLTYEVVDISEDETAREYVRSLGHLQAPVVITPDGTHWAGYRPDQIQHLVDHAAVSVA